MSVIGIDEIALKKGHRDFVAIVSAYIDGELRVIGILAERTKAAVRDFFLSIPKRLRRTVKMVCSDLYVGFISAAKSVFGPHVAICADRFHVAKLYRQGVDAWVFGVFFSNFQWYKYFRNRTLKTLAII